MNSHGFSKFRWLFLALVLLGSGELASAQELLWVKDGDPDHNDHLGFVLQSVPDLNGDGVGEVLAGDPKWIDDVGHPYGEVQVLSGVDGALLWRKTGEFDSNFGIGLGTVSDVDGDGLRDLFVGANTEVTIGRAHVLSYATGDLLSSYSGTHNSNFGTRVLEVDDVDGDGVRDHLVAAPGWADFAPYRRAGKYYLFSGRDHSLLDEVRGEDEWNDFSLHIELVSDLDGDGLRDLVVAAYGWVSNNSEGKIYAYSIAPPARLLWQVEGSFRQLLGINLANVGDQDGDGFDDVAVTGHEGGDWDTPWVVHIYSGKDGALLHRIFEFDPEGYFGNGGLIGAGDMDGDGRSDFLVGDYGVDDGFVDNGHVYLFQGGTFRHLYTWVGRQPASTLGIRCAAPGDVNGDGLADIVISAPNEDVRDKRDDTGRIYSFAGNDLFLLPTTRRPLEGDPVTCQIRAGDAGEPYLLAVTSVNGQPHFQTLSFGLLDPNGEANFTATVPAGLSGTDLGLRAFAKKAPHRVGSRLGDSIEEHVVVQ